MNSTNWPTSKLSSFTESKDEGEISSSGSSEDDLEVEIWSDKLLHCCNALVMGVQARKLLTSIIHSNCCWIVGQLK